MPLNLDLMTAKIEELKKAQDRVRALETELKALIAGEDEPQKLPDLWEAASLVTRIASLLEGNSHRSFHFKEIYNTVGNGSNEASVRSTIAKLINDKKIQRVTWGEYKALQKEERPKAG